MTTALRRRAPDDERSGRSSLGWGEREARSLSLSPIGFDGAVTIAVSSDTAKPMIARMTLFPPTLWLAAMLTALAHADSLPYPETPKNPVSEVHHGVTVVDPYRWLESDGTPEVKRWTVAQNALTRRYLDAIPQRPAIAKRVAELLHSEPVQHYDFQFRKQLFAMKQQPPRNQPSLVVLKPTGMLESERTVLDPLA